MSRTITFWVRASDGSMEKLPASYEADELWMMRTLTRKADAAPAGSEARERHLNEVLTIHELKALFPGSRFEGIEVEEVVMPTQDSLFQIPEKALVELGQQPLPLDGKSAAAGEGVQGRLPDPDEDRLGKFMAPEHGAPETQRRAAVAAYPRTGTWRRKVLDEIGRAGERGMTDEELYGALRGDENTIRPRRNELLNDGWIEESGIERKTPSGKDAMAWVLTEQGRREWQPARQA